MRLQLPMPPSANRIWRVCRGRIVLSEEARAYKAKVRLLARVQGVGGRPSPGPSCWC